MVVDISSEKSSRAESATLARRSFLKLCSALIVDTGLPTANAARSKVGLATPNSVAKRCS